MTGKFAYLSLRLAFIVVMILPLFKPFPHLELPIHLPQSVTTVHAATMNVNTTALIADDGFCSLSEAVINANTNAQIFATAGECPAGQAAPTVDEIILPPGTYPVANSLGTADGLLITEGAITIRSALYTGVSPNDTVNPFNPNLARVPGNEVILVPSVNNVDDGIIISINVTNPLPPPDRRIIIDGVILDGDNPFIPGGVNVNGADSNAAVGFGTFSSLSPNGIPTNQITLQNTIVRNFNWYGIGVFQPGAATVSHDIIIANNRVENMSGINPFPFGRVAIVVANSNTYAQINNNTVVGSRTGIQTGNNLIANPATSPAPSMSGNYLRTERVGIFHNLQYTNATNYTITNNVIEAQPGFAGSNVGIWFSSIQSPVTAVVSNNTISGSARGYDFWNVSTSAGLTVNGSTLINNDTGVLIYDVSSSFGNAGVGTNNITLNNFSISGSASHGIRIVDGAAPNVDLNLTLNNSTVQGSLINGIFVEDNDAASTNNPRLSVDSSRIQANATGVNIVGGFDAASGITQTCIVQNTAGVTNPIAQALDALNNWWGNNTGPGGVGGGGGDTITANVNFAPFALTALTAGNPPLLCPDSSIPPITPPPPTEPPVITVSDPAISKIGFLEPGGVGLTGETLTWEITVRNITGQAAANVVVSDVIPVNLRILQVTTSQGTSSTNGQSVTFNLGTLNAGQTAQLQIITQVLSSPNDGLVVNQACASGGIVACAEASVQLVKGLPDTGYPPRPD